MSQKHTPGPWHMGEGNGKGSIFKTGEGRMRFEQPGGTTLYPICAMVRGWNDQEDEANARLIAASPEMLEALRGADAAIKYAMAAANTEADYSAICAIQDAVRAAIANATGVMP